MDVCLMFYSGTRPGGSGKREITKDLAIDIIREARANNLVARPFRDQTRTFTLGSCFCCNDGCAYFFNPGAVRDKGTLISFTDKEICNHWGACVDVCYFKARIKDDSQMGYDENICWAAVYAWTNGTWKASGCLYETDRKYNSSSTFHAKIGVDLSLLA
jgi:hypothetical protein